MGKIRSPDGTRITYARSGSGSPLILVQGTGAANPAAWTAVIPGLEKHFTVYALDRRGRGESGDNAAYAIQREFEDIAAVANGLGEPVNLLGHSFGGLLALEAALLIRNLGKLVLYQPPFPLPGMPLFREGAVDRLQTLLDAGDRTGVLITHYRENVKMQPQEIDLLQSSSAWASRIAAAHTLPREMRALEQYTFEGQRFKNLNTPTLLLLGGESPSFSKLAVEAVDAALPNSQITVMPGQEHIAMYTAPDLFLHEVLTFLFKPG